MGTINNGAIEKSTGQGENIATVTCGVQRKVNIGNFESVDIYCAATLPVALDDPTDKAEVEEKLIEAMEDLIHYTSKETGEKYKLVKGLAD